MGSYKFPVVFFLLFGLSASAGIFFPSLSSGFKSLQEYDYFRARKIFFHYRQSRSFISELGLADIYSRFDNPFSNRDSAFSLYARIKQSHERLSMKDLVDNAARYNITEKYYTTVIHRIDSLGFAVAQQKNTIGEYEKFIMFFRDAPEQKTAYRNIEVLSYKEAVQQNSSYAYQSFLRKFGSSPEAASARQMLDAALFRECLETGSLQELHQFPEKFPESAYVSAAQDSLYARSIPVLNEKNLENFIRSFPSNKNVNKAWYELYQLGNDNSAEFYKKFISRFPDYPLLKEVTQELYLAEKEFYAIQSKGKWGFIDEKGTLMIPPMYEGVETFSEGLCVVQVERGFGYINKSGRMVIPAQYDDAEPFTEGMALVKKGSGYFFINRSGTRIPGAWQDASDFSEGLAAVKKEGAFGYIDPSGHLVIDAVFDNAGDFSNGFAVVDSAGKSGVINRSGTYVFKPTFEWIDDFRSGMARYQENESYGLLSLQGHVLIPAQYEMLEFLSDSFLLAAKDGKCGIISLNASAPVSLPYDYAGNPPQVNGPQVVFSLKGKSGLVQQDGKVLLPFEYAGMKLAGRGLYGFQKKLKWGLLDSARRIILKPAFDGLSYSVNGRTAVQKKKKWGLVNEEGKWLAEARFDNLTHKNYGWESSRKSLKGLLDQDGTELLEPEMQEIKEVLPYLLRLTKNNLIAYYHTQSRQYIWMAEGF